MSQKQKHKVLSLEEKREIIHECDKGQKKDIRGQRIWDSIEFLINSFSEDRKIPKCSENRKRYEIVFIEM